jgi:hypothetical protein
MRILFLILTFFFFLPVFSQNPEKAELEKKKKLTLQD